MKILITGGVGFIGTNCAIYFAKQKNKVVLIDDFSRTGVDKNAKYLINYYPNLIKIIKCRVGKIELYKKELITSNVIIHLAGQTAVTTSIKDPEYDFENNLHDSFLLLNAVKKYNPSVPLLFASTNKVYGNLSKHQTVLNKKIKQYIDICHPQGIDETEPVDFISPYGCSKGATDLYFLDFARIYGLKTVVFRQSCIYGPHQLGVEDQGWVAHFSKQIIRKQPITIFGNGFQVRDLLHVDDLIYAYDLAIKKINKVSGQAINVGGGVNNAFSLNQVISILEKKTNNHIQISYQLSRLGDQPYFVSDNKKAKKLLNWKPLINFKQGINSLIKWQINNL